MIPQTQSRTGPTGRCFSACLASILEIPENSVPDFMEDDDNEFQAHVDEFLSRFGLQYKQVPIDGVHPVGWHTVEGISPRGGMHAVVGRDGRMVWDPHPPDGTGRFLKKPMYYGLLLPAKKVAAKDAQKVEWRKTSTGDWITSDGKWKVRNTSFLKPMFWVYHNLSRYTPTGKYEDAVSFSNVRDAKKFVESMIGRATDAATTTLFGKRLANAAEKVLELHDDVVYDNPARQDYFQYKIGTAETAYRGTHQQVVRVVQEAASLLDRASLDDDIAYWRDKLSRAQRACKAAEQSALRGQYGTALAEQEGGLTLAHAVINKMRAQRGRGKDVEVERVPMAGEPITLPSGKRTKVRRVVPATDLFGRFEWHVSTTTGEVLPVTVKEK